jgi:hypothetical protein
VTGVGRRTSLCCWRKLNMREKAKKVRGQGVRRLALREMTNFSQGHAFEWPDGLVGHGSDRVEWAHAVGLTLDDDRG